MKQFFLLPLLVFLPFAPFAQMVDPNTPADAKPSNTNIGSNWKLDFSDEFNDAAVNTEKWTINVSSKSRNPRPKIGVKDWWWKADNVWQEDGKLVLRVDKHDHNTMHCGSVNSKEKYETMYGYFEARIKVADASKGTHTAFWFHGKGMSNVDGTANDGAEIDVFESAWLEDYTKSVIHIDGYGKNHKANTKKYNTPGIHEGYHTFGLHWTENFMKIYYDGKLKVTYSGADWIVHANEYLWLSDGASFGISGDHFTKLAVGTLTHAYVDYVRVWKPMSTVTETNSIAYGKPVTVGSVYKDNYGGANIVDGDVSSNSSRWVSGKDNFPTWAEVDLEKEYKISGFKFYTGFDGYNYPITDYKFQYWDGSTWQDAISETGNTEAVVEKSFEPVISSKVRLYIENSTEGYARVYELEVYGEEHSVVTGVDQIVNPSINLYPVPVSSELFIEGLSSSQTVKIYDISGNLVYSEFTKKKINISHLKAGVYILKISGFKKTKFIKK